MNIFIKIAIIFVITLIGVFTAFIVANRQWVAASVVTYATDTSQVTPTVIVAPTAPNDSPIICAGEARLYRAAIAPLITEWNDAVQLAMQSPRMSLPPGIANLQSIRRETARIEPGSCTKVKNAHTALLLAMDAMNEGFLAFLGKEEQIIIDRYFKTSTTEMDIATSLLDEAGK